MNGKGLDCDARLIIFNFETMIVGRLTRNKRDILIITKFGLIKDPVCI